MRNGEKGLTLIEAVAALAILTFVVLFLLPMFPLLIKEQQSISQERKAHYLLEKEALMLERNLSLNERYEGYEVYREKEGEGTNVCITWEGDNKRTYEKCLFVLPEGRGDDTL